MELLRVTVPEFTMEGLSDRLRQVLKDQKRTRPEVSESAGLSKGYLTNVITRGQAPTIPKLHAICAELGVSMSWVVYGERDACDRRALALALTHGDTKKAEAILALLG